MAKEQFIVGKHDDGHHDGLASYRRRLEAALADEEIGEQIAVSLMVYRQRHQLTPALVDYHESILRTWGILPESPDVSPTSGG